MTGHLEFKGEAMVYIDSLGVDDGISMFDNLEIRIDGGSFFVKAGDTKNGYPIIRWVPKSADD